MVVDFRSDADLNGGLNPRKAGPARVIVTRRMRNVRGKG